MWGYFFDNFKWAISFIVELFTQSLGFPVASMEQNSISIVVSWQGQPSVIHIVLMVEICHINFGA
jgi:hypothetical protein